MPPKLLFDLTGIDLEGTAFGIEEIRGRNSQRFEMEMLERIIHFDPESGRSVGFRPIREDEFWARGHFPGRPVFPGVLMIESAGQLCSFFYSEKFGSDKVMGFAACDEVKFRGMIQPGDEMVILSEVIDIRPRNARFQTQVVVADEVRFEGIIVGMPL